MRSRVEAVGTVRLILDTGHHLDLEYTFFFTSFYRKFISISRNILILYQFSFFLVASL